VFLSGAPTASAVVDSYADAIDSVTDFETGVDTLDLSGVQGLGSVSIVRMGAGSAVFAQSVGQSSDLQTVIGVTGLIQAGDIAGPYASLQMVGDERDDVLVGGDHADSLYGQDGDDVLIGGGAGDALYGGTGADIFR
jgi:Ca2+-binding RTX toxin-like protein